MRKIHTVATTSLLVALVLPIGLAGTTSAAWAAGRTWYVGADAALGGDGTPARPFRTLAAVEIVSGAGDVIRVLPAHRALDGGIQLKPGQRIAGSGPAVTTLGETSPAPTITNTTAARLAGDAIRLADGATVQNLRLRSSYRGAVYGKEVTGVVVADNDIAGQNTSCSKGFLIPGFNAPTNVPGVGIPLVMGLQNGWAAVMVDAERRTGGTVSVSGNRVHDATCGDGIDVRVWGSASYTASILDNQIMRLEQGPHFLSLLAIGLQSRDQARLSATVSRNSQADLGNADDPNLVAGADSEGVFVNASGPAFIEVGVDHNTYTNERGLGGFSANGLEMVTMGSGSRARVVVRDSTFSGSPGDVIEEGALGTDALLEMELYRVRAERSTGVGNTLLVPFNNGDCLLAGSLGARNDVRLAVRDSVIADCSNNGLSVGSNVVNGHGATANIEVDVARTTITGNRGGNVGIRNFTALDRLRIKVEDSDLAGSDSLGSAIADVSAETLAPVGSSVIDLGGGALGSAGGNCVRGGLFAVDVVGFDVAMQRAWWGQPGGPGPLRTLVLGSLDTADPLDSKPAYCR